jgi:thiol:disulfide interchange protein
LTTIATNVPLNLFFFAIFIFFAFSFFGYYELTLPSSWGNTVDSSSNMKGGIGIFFMALTLAIVSFSCTGPILGSLLAGSLTTDGGAMQLTVGMTGFGFALALPFALFALFPNALNALPKSGGWMTTVKVVLGFLELALALKFLSNADLVSHWGLLKREVFIGIWVFLASGLTLYLFGLIRFPTIKKENYPRLESELGF